MSRQTRALVRIPGSGGEENDGPRPSMHAARRRLAQFAPELDPSDSKLEFGLELMQRQSGWFKLAGLAALLCGAYFVGWSSAEPAHGTASVPQPAPQAAAPPVMPPPGEPAAAAVMAPPAVPVVAPPADPPATPPATAIRRLNNEEMREIQARLATLGHDPGPVDGMFGPQTVSATKRYEISLGLEPTGSIDLRLLERLRHEP